MVKAAALISLLTAAAFGTSITPSGLPTASPDDLFNISNGAVVDSNSPLVYQYNIEDMFGGMLSTGSEGPGRVLFADDNTNPWIVSMNPGDYYVNFSTSSPILLSSFNLYLQDDFNDTADRTVTDFQLYANTTLIANVTILASGQLNYESVYGSDTIEVSDTFAPVDASSFTAVFTDNPLARPTADGPRVLGLQGFGTADAPDPYVPTSSTPEPSSFVLMAVGFLGLLLVRRGFSAITR